MKKSVLIITLFLFALTIYSCSVDEIDTPQTQKTIELAQPEPVTKVNAEVKTVSDTLSQNKNNKAFMMEIEGVGNQGANDVPIRK